jgi:putative transposase
VIYTTNGIEALNRHLRKAIKTKGHFSSEDAARKLIHLAVEKRHPAMDPRTRAWTMALVALELQFGDPTPEIAA